MSQEGYDIVIIGEGAAGCVVASYLAERTDASIAPIEAGDMDHDPFIHIPAGFAKMLVHDRHVWKYETVPQHGTKPAYRSGKALGSGSSIDAMCRVRGQIGDHAAWQDAVGDTGRWSYEDLAPVFMAQEDNDTFHDEYHGIDGCLVVQPPKGINKLNQYCPHTARSSNADQQQSVVGVASWITNGETIMRLESSGATCGTRPTSCGDKLFLPTFKDNPVRWIVVLSVVDRQADQFAMPNSPTSICENDGQCLG